MPRLPRTPFCALLPLLMVACAGDSDVNKDVDTSEAYYAEAWADNWFAMYIGDTLVVEDSVPITTERSFNAEVFSFDADPGAVLSFVLKDFKETDSGLEYIGEANQQMGDGGFIAQIFDQQTGELLLTTDTGWRCMVTHEAPLNKECASSSDPDADCMYEITEEPDGWKDADYDDAAWESATTYTAAEVSPKEGYDQISWDSSAGFIWGDDLESINTLLCRVTLP